MIEDSSSQNESFLTIDYAWFMTQANRHVVSIETSRLITWRNKRFDELAPNYVT